MKFLFQGYHGYLLDKERMEQNLFLSDDEGHV